MLLCYRYIINRSILVCYSTIHKCIPWGIYRTSKSLSVDPHNPFTTMILKKTSGLTACGQWPQDNFRILWLSLAWYRLQLVTGMSSLTSGCQTSHWPYRETLDLLPKKDLFPFTNIYNKLETKATSTSNEAGTLRPASQPEEDNYGQFSHSHLHVFVYLSLGQGTDRLLGFMPWRWYCIC